MKATAGKKLALLAGLGVVVVAVAAGAVCRRELQTWYVLWTFFDRLPANAQGCAEYRHRQTGIIFVRLRGGKFSMGREGSKGKERPKHVVTLSPFLIGRYEVNQAEWRRLMNSNPSQFQGDDLPVEEVSWNDCQAFCKKTQLSLPTEAQWEYACRAGTETAFTFGEVISPEQANYECEPPGKAFMQTLVALTPGDEGEKAFARLYGRMYGRTKQGGSKKRTAPVGSFPPNAWGIHDMHGNVWEWCEDAYDGDFYTSPEATARNPVCSRRSSFMNVRVRRGGSWRDEAFRSASWARSWFAVRLHLHTIGFRPVFNLP